MPSPSAAPYRPKTQATMKKLTIKQLQQQPTVHIQPKQQQALKGGFVITEDIAGF